MSGMSVMPNDIGKTNATISSFCAADMPATTASPNDAVIHVVT